MCIRRVVMAAFAVACLIGSTVDNGLRPSARRADSPVTAATCTQAASASLVYGYGWVVRPTGCG